MLHFLFVAAVIVIGLALLPVALAVLPWLAVGALIVGLFVTWLLLLAYDPATGLLVGGVVLAGFFIHAWRSQRLPSQRKRREEEWEEFEEGHPHKCEKGHWWQHTGTTAAKCAIPTRYHNSDQYVGYIGSEDCPICTGREELLIRGPHLHYCITCEGKWRHEGRCTDGTAFCPWCYPSPDGPTSAEARRGPHKHYCPQCFQKWEHNPPPSPEPSAIRRFTARFQGERVVRPDRALRSCAAPHRAVLPECPGCQALRTR